MHKTFKEDKIWMHSSKKKGYRWWLHWGKTAWHYEGYLGKNANHNTISCNLGGEENDIQVHFGIKRLFNFYFGVEDFFPRKLMSKLFGYDSRMYGISLFEEYISIEFHRDDMGYSEGWRGYHKMIDWKSILFGKQKFDKEELGEYGVYVDMPEGKYPAKVKMFKSTWTRKRFIKPIEMIRGDITPAIAIPIPGKGENAHDIGDDAIYSSTIPADSPQEAAEELAESVMETRRKYANESWVPRDGFEVNK
ncbi:hypothetical protein JOC34_000594 [Virgibacillus halotolerans]|uniref:hypothetical protein n=1 Tax=Virgibacillus halotolerans TaxID=1071053 RepID=UPI001960DB05|nr:hypothetical protein [Virgibacillus halotolerans]MBM7598237.1 hypothetical protein [Virgibacillus halotolerans]